MGILRKMGDGQGYVRYGVLGFNGSGKTVTTTYLACAIRRHFGLDGPIVMWDSEGGSEYVAPIVKLLTGQDLVGVSSLAFADLCEAHAEAEQAGAACFIADSITHAWRELCKSHLARINAIRARNSQPPRQNLVMRDWMVLKEHWADKWATPYVNRRIHSLICGRAGFEYDIVQDEETGQQEIQKSGVKMKTESEFGFEPSLLVEMERHQVVEEDTRRIVRRATVLKDRFGVIDGETKRFENQGDHFKNMEAVWAFFAPHIEQLKAGAHSPVDPTLKTDTGADEEGNTAWSREKRQREIYCEEIKGELVAAWPGRSTVELKAKNEIVKTIFGTHSWKKIEGMRSEDLKEGLARLRETIHELVEPEGVEA